MKKNYCLLLVAIFMFSGCASLPSPEEMRADIQGFELPKLPQNGEAIVYVVRPSSLGTIIRFNVFLDDKEAQSEMGYTRGSEYIYFDVSPGKHNILSKAENWAEANIEASPGDIFFIQQDPSMGIIMARNSLRKLKRNEGTYQVKHLSLGTIIREK